MSRGLSEIMEDLNSQNWRAGQFPVEEMTKELSAIVCDILGDQPNIASDDSPYPDGFEAKADLFEEQIERAYDKGFEF